MSGRDPLRDKGSATLELVVLTPALLAVLGTVLIAGRFEAASGAVEQASAAAARAASLARTPSTAEAAARRAATATLDGRDLRCTGLDVAVRTTSTPGEVSATVSCNLDLSATGLPGTRRLTGRTVSVTDVYRSAP